MHLAVNLHINLVAVPPPMAKPAHRAHAGGEWRRQTSGPQRFDQNRTVSWHTSMPRSNSRSATLRRHKGKRTYISTTRRMTAGDEFKQRNGLGGLALEMRLIPELDDRDSGGLS